MLVLIYSTYRFCTKNSVSAKSELALTDCPTGYDVETWYGVSPNINFHRAFAVFGKISMEVDGAFEKRISARSAV